MQTPYINNSTCQIADECYTIGGSFNKETVWDKSLIEETLEILRGIESPMLLDVGANLGSFSLLSIFIPDLKVIAFEPFHEVAELLKRNLDLNKSINVEIHEMALSDCNGEADLKCCFGNSGMSTMGPYFNILPYTEKKIKVMTLDKFYEEKPFSKLDFIKIDTEGSELNILKGAENTIKRFKPIILIETYQKRTGYFGYSPDMIIDQLKMFGYKKFEMRKEDTFAWFNNYNE